MNRKNILIITLVTTALIAIYITGGYILKDPERLPVYNPADLNPELVDSSLQRVGRNFKTGPFRVVNQLGDTITEKSVEGKIRVVNFFFTTCPSICVDMTREMKHVQNEFKDDNRLIIMSHSVMPTVDSIPVLREYAEINGIDPSIWWLVRAEEDEIQRLARKVYFAVKDGYGNEDDHGFIHTENVVLVDSYGRLRGFYDGTDPEDMERLIHHIKVLMTDDTPRY